MLLSWLTFFLRFTGGYQKFIIAMNDNSSISKLRECFNQSTFFSTEVSSPSRAQFDKESPHLVKISSKFTDEPHQYLKKVRIKKKEASMKCLQALKGAVKAKLELERVEHEAAISRYDFMRLYNIKKFKLDEQALLSTYRADSDFTFRLSLERTKRQRVLNQLSLTSRKEQQTRNIEQLFETNKQHKNIFRETLRMSQEKAQNNAQVSAEKVRKEKASFQIRKKHQTELMTTKSKFNYLSKVNEEMQAIKEYQQIVDSLQKDPDYIETQSYEWRERQIGKTRDRNVRLASTFTSSFH